MCLFFTGCFTGETQQKGGLFKCFFSTTLWAEHLKIDVGDTWGYYFLLGMAIFRTCLLVLGPSISSWCFQPIWKICSSNRIIIHPNFKKSKNAFQTTTQSFFVSQATEWYIQIHKELRRVLPDPLGAAFEKPASDLPDGRIDMIKMPELFFG